MGVLINAHRNEGWGHVQLLDPSTSVVQASLEAAWVVWKKRVCPASADCLLVR
jgi:hypothetical protein